MLIGEGGNDDQPVYGELCLLAKAPLSSQQQMPTPLILQLISHSFPSLVNKTLRYLVRGARLIQLLLCLHMFSKKKCLHIQLQMLLCYYCNIHAAMILYSMSPVSISSKDDDWASWFLISH